MVIKWFLPILLQEICKKVKKVLNISFGRLYSTINIDNHKQVIICNRYLPRPFVVESLAKIK